MNWMVPPEILSLNMTFCDVGLFGNFNSLPETHLVYSIQYTCTDSAPVVVVVFFTLTDRASTIPSNTRGCQSGTWSAGQKNISYQAPMRAKEKHKHTKKRQRERNRNNKIHRSEKDKEGHSI